MNDQTIQQKQSSGKSYLSQIPNQADSHQEPIAIIGAGCRFPGGIHDLETFWQFLQDEGDAITEIPKERFDIDELYDPTPGKRGKIAIKEGGFLENIDQFDPLLFGISPREANYLDPQQRLLLEVAWEALEDGGVVLTDVAGSQTAVFIGQWLNDFETLLLENTDQSDFYMTTGSGRYASSGRISYTFGFQGPSVTLDTACSSSLVAIHLACQSIWQGESEMALAGGANTILQPYISIAYSQSNMMAPDGRCKFGDSRANGYVRSEGAAMIVLKPLSKAIAENDRIHAIILGSAVNNDGKTSGHLATPAQIGQAQLLRLAYKNANISPGQLGYVEAHGTGTRAGDPVEIGALADVLATDRPENTPCYVGSVKTNFGHTEGAAGIAGLLKVVLSLKNRTIPTSLNIKEPNPAIAWDEIPIRLANKQISWPSELETAVAGVSAFGIAGTNAHIVLAEAPAPEVIQEPAGKNAYLLPLSAQSEEGIQSLAKQYQTLLTRQPNLKLADIAYTAAVRRPHHDERLTLIATDRSQLLESLESLVNDEQPLFSNQGRTRYEQPKVAFIFPGQGSQWVGMGRELMAQEPIFQQTMAACAAAIAQFSDWSLLEQLYLEPDDPNYRLDQIDVIQPTLLAVEIALAALWQSWGVVPDAVVGHSMGEVGAAYIAGALSLEEAMSIICYRSQLMRRTSGQGAMAVVELTIAEAEAAIQGQEDKLSIAVSNSPRSTVVSGDPTALDTLMSKLKADDIFCRKVKVDVASHSPQMEPLMPELRELLASLQPQTTDVPIYSTSQAAVVDGAEMNPDFWASNLRQPVRFSQMIQQLLTDGVTVFIEMSPHPILLTAVQQSFQTTTKGVTLASLRRNEPEQATLLNSLGQLYTIGGSFDWKQLYPTGQVVTLPSYPWQRERFWFETSQSGNKRTRLGYPLLDDYLVSANGQHIWEVTLHSERFPYLAAGETAVSTEAAFIEMVLEAVQDAFEGGPHELHSVSFSESLTLANNNSHTIQLIIEPGMSGMISFTIYGRSEAGDTHDWTQYGQGQVRISAPDQLSSQLEASDTDTIIQQPEELASYQIHPAILNQIIQSVSQGITCRPVGFDRFRLLAQIETESKLVVRTRLHHNEKLDLLRGDVELLDDSGNLVASISGLQLTTQSQPDTSWLYNFIWQPQALETSEIIKPELPGSWLLFTDNNGIANTLRTNLVELGETVFVVRPGQQFALGDNNEFVVDPSNPDNFLQMMLAITDGKRPLRGIIHLWSLNQQENLHTAQEQGALATTYLIQAIDHAQLEIHPRLWLVTQGSQAVNTNSLQLAQTPLWGLGRVVWNEHPELKCINIDLDKADTSADTLWSELWHDASEREIAFAEGMRYTSRLVHQTNTEETSTQPLSTKTTILTDQPYQIINQTPGTIAQLEPVISSRSALRSGEVEIEVKATGLNFMNVLAALDTLPGYADGSGPLGIECAGVVTAVSDDVTTFKPGDNVVGIAYNSLAKIAVTNHHLLAHKPENLSFAEAATIPVAFMTAYYALHQQGRLESNERILIHATTGGVGLAAVQFAQRTGADIFATVSSPEKQTYLHSIGVDTIMDSRSLAFADEIMTLTDGEGIDLVLNSLAGEAVTKGLEILRPYGRFIEIGKRDIYENSRLGLLPFQKNLTYTAVNLDAMCHQKPQMAGKLLQEVMDLFQQGELTLLPIETVSITAVTEAFQTMVQAEHLGKIVITHDTAQLPVHMASRTQPAQVSADGTYLITGGLGGLGLVMAQWLADQGAKHLALIGRRGPSPSAQLILNQLATNGIQATHISADVADEASLKAAFAHIEANMPPLRGIIHAAGVLDDSTLTQMNAEQFWRVMAPKLDGAWHLHKLTRERPLDFFVLFSSVASLLGNPGQGNYAAANAFLDALAHQRRATGLPATSINWGPWAEVGLAAAQSNRGDRLAQRGLGSISQEKGYALFDTIFSQNPTQAVAMDFDLSTWATTYPAAANNSLFSELAQEIPPETTAATTSIDIRTEIETIPPGSQRRQFMESHIQGQAAQVLRLAPSRVPLDRPLKTLGLDSLMTLELRNRLESEFDLTLSATLIFNYPTVATLTTFLAKKLKLPLEMTDEVAQSKPIIADSLSNSDSLADLDGTTDIELEELDDLAQDELESLLAEELSAIDDLLQG